MPHVDPLVRRAYHRAWKRRNRGRYSERDRASDAARHANQRAEKYGAPGRITADEAQAILREAKCYWCQSTEPSPWWGLDHVVPLNAGGANRPENIRCSCHSCNASKYRADRPGRWSRLFEACRGCGTHQRRHVSRGLCNRCYLAAVKAGDLNRYPRLRDLAPAPTEVLPTLQGREVKP